MVILAVLALVMAFLALLYLNLQPDMEWTLEGGILRVLSSTDVLVIIDRYGYFSTEVLCYEKFNRFC